jgi:isoquinoline 1-oxidoreductase beta subunit
LRDPSEWRLIGKPMQRVDIVEKSTGTPGLWHRPQGRRHGACAVVLNPAQTGPMNSFDASEALKMRGVKQVVEVTGGVAVIADNTWRAFQAAGRSNSTGARPRSPTPWKSTGQALADSFTDDALRQPPAR